MDNFQFEKDKFTYERYNFELERNNFQLEIDNFQFEKDNFTYERDNFELERDNFMVEVNHSEVIESQLNGTKTLAFTCLSNIVLDNSMIDVKNEDYFAPFYGHLTVKMLFVLNYFIGLVGLIGIIFIIWFEFSGRAGPFRTLVNQVVCFNMISVIKKISC